LYSTLGDLLRFDQALRSGKLLGRKVLRRLWTTTPESRARLPYGMGFTVLELPGDTVVGHGGGIDGVSDSFEMHLGTGVTAIVLAAAVSYLLNDLWTFGLGRLRGKAASRG